MPVRYFRHPEAGPGHPPVAAQAGDLVFLGGHLAAHPTEGVPSEAKLEPGLPYHGSSIGRQAHYIFKAMARSLDAAGSSLEQGLKINSYHTEPREVDMALRVRHEYFGAEPPPSTAVIVAETPVRGTSVVIDLVALARDAELKRQAFRSARAPTFHDRIYGVPTYVEVVKGGGLIFTQGKGPSPIRGPIPEALGHPDLPYQSNQIRVEAEYALNVLKTLLEESGASLEHVVRAEVHLTNMEDIAEVDEVWRKFFPKDPPARVVVPVSELLVAKMRIEIELVAVDPAGPWRKEVVATPEAPTPLGHEAQAVKAGPYLFFSTQMATDWRSGVAPEARVDPAFPFHTSAVKRQVRYILKNVEATCRAAGTSVENLVRRRAVHLDLADYSVAEEVWQELLSERLPPTTAFRVPEPLPVPGCKVQYDLTAYIP